MKKMLALGLLFICPLAQAELLNSQNKPATTMIEVAKWQPKPSLVPLLDRWYADIPQMGVSWKEFQKMINNHVYDFFDKPNASHQDFQHYAFFMNFGFHSSQYKEEHVKEVQKLHKYLSLYTSHALQLLAERQDLLQHYIDFRKQSNHFLIEKDIQTIIDTLYHKSLNAWMMVAVYIVHDITFEKEVENSIQMFLHNTYLN